MTKKVVLVVASTGFQHDEYHHTYDALVKAGIRVTTASDKKGQATAHDGSTVHVDVALDDVQIALCDGIFLIGGRGALRFLDTPVVYRLFNEALVTAKSYGAICIAPRILAKAQVLCGKKATCWDDDHATQAIFDEHQVTFIHEPVVVDGKIITANGPLAATAFGQAITITI